MWRAIKLFLNLLLTSLVFNYFILILILLLNPQISINNNEFFILYLNLSFYYVPIWFVIIGFVFFIIQFFSEKKYPIGIFNPPTLTYFLSFTILTISFILFFNYDYYFEFFPSTIKASFIKILLLNLILIIIGIIFVFFKKINKKWIQFFFLIFLLYNIINSYASTIFINHSNHFLDKNKKEKILFQKITPRKIRIVILDGLSLNTILSKSSKQKLLNFNLLINEGVRGRILGFKPNFNLSLINSALTGLKPSEFTRHSNYRFKFSNLEHEFDIFPKYIFFRTSSNLNFTAIFKKKYNNYLDYINKYYESNNFETIQIIQPPNIYPYSEKSLKKNNRFITLFSDILKRQDKKYDILKKSFFLDDYLKSINTDLKESNKYYSIIYFPGLGIISKFFYQYYLPQIFGNISEMDIKNYGWIMGKYYEYYDSIIGNLIKSTGDNELLVILSFYEYEPLPVWRRILINLFSREDIYVYKSLYSQGSILLYERNAIKKGYPLKTISVYDIFPTLLYYSGFQLPKYLQGEVIREIFTDEFVLNNPIDINTRYSNGL